MKGISNCQKNVSPEWTNHRILLTDSKVNDKSLYLSFKVLLEPCSYHVRVRAQLRNYRSNFHRKMSEAENCDFKLTFICSNFPYLRQTVLPLTAMCVKAYVIALHCPWPKGIFHVLSGELSSLSAVTSRPHQLSAKIRNTRQVAGKKVAFCRLAVTALKYVLNMSEVDYGVHVTRLQLFSLIRWRKRLCRLGLEHLTESH